MGIFDGDPVRICWDFYRKNSCVFFMGILWIFGRNFFERLCATSVEKIGVIFFFVGFLVGILRGFAGIATENFCVVILWDFCERLCEIFVERFQLFFVE